MFAESSRDPYYNFIFCRIKVHARGHYHETVKAKRIKIASRSWRYQLVHQEKRKTFSIYSHFNYADVVQPRKRISLLLFLYSTKNHSTLSWSGIKDRIINSLLMAREMLLMSGVGWGRGKSYPFENRKSLGKNGADLEKISSIIKRHTSQGKRSEYIMNAIRYGEGGFGMGKFYHFSSAILNYSKSSPLLGVR